MFATAIASPICLATGRAARAHFAARLHGLSHERFCLAFLDRNGVILGEMAFDGDADHAAMPLREVMAEALRLDAQGMIAAHNHPGGRAEPSRADLYATRRLAEVAWALGIALRDHLILLPDGRATSFRALGLI